MKIKRSTLLLGIGILGITAETVASLAYRQQPNAALLLLFGAMMGLPVFITSDMKGSVGDGDERPEDNGDEDDPDPPHRPRSRRAPPR